MPKAIETNVRTKRIILRSKRDRDKVSSYIHATSKVMIDGALVFVTAVDIAMQSDRKYPIATITYRIDL